MGLLSQNIIPGNHGKTFGTNAMNEDDLRAIKTGLLEIDGISDIVLNTGIFPREFTIYTTKIISLAEVENKVKSVGFHAIPKETFEL
jgi:hypothetical protein